MKETVRIEEETKAKFPVDCTGIGKQMNHEKVRWREHTPLYPFGMQREGEKEDYRKAAHSPSNRIDSYAIHFIVERRSLVVRTYFIVAPDFLYCLFGPNTLLGAPSLL